MATKLISRRLLRRFPHSLLRPFSLLSPQISDSTQPVFFFPSTTTPFRFYSSKSPDSDFTHRMNSVTESELRNLGFIDGSQTPNLLDDSILPVRAVVGLLDGFHDLTGLPWWIVIVTSTVALRAALFPWVVLQLHKMKHIAEAMPKLPPPLPPPFSGISFKDQFSLFRRERRAVGCPSFLWFLASFTVQFPCFILWMASIRRMSLSQHPGFDTGGILWFQDLTVVPNGSLGLIFPLLIAGLHFCNVQIGFRGSFVGKQTGMLFFLAKCYKIYLNALTLPLLFVGFYVPQGSLVYWVTNSSLTLVQQLCLKDPHIRQRLGLPDHEALRIAAESEKEVKEKLDAPRKPKMISAFDLSPLGLVEVSLQYFSAGNTEKAIHLLRVAVDKDPACYKAWTILGQIMLQKELFEDAAECSEIAIYQISSLEEPADIVAIDSLIQASVIAGSAIYRQGKLAEALVHFERARDIEVPENETVKSHYYQALVAFACLLSDVDRKAEALQYFRMAVAYDPQYAVFLKNSNLENNADDFVSDLTSSRRADY